MSEPIPKQTIDQESLERLQRIDATVDALCKSMQAPNLVEGIAKLQNQIADLQSRLNTIGKWAVTRRAEIIAGGKSQTQMTEETCLTLHFIAQKCGHGN